MNYKITRKSLETLIENVLREQHEPDKLYSREYIVNVLRKGPRELKRYIKDLPHIQCFDKYHQLQASDYEELQHKDE